MCWITSCQRIHPPIEGPLPPSSTESKPFQNSVSKVARLQVHDTKSVKNVFRTAANILRSSSDVFSIVLPWDVLGL